MTPLEITRALRSKYRRAQRARYYATGLTSAGRPRKNARHPDLAGLDRLTYHRLYKRKIRSLCSL